MAKKRSKKRRRWSEACRIIRIARAVQDRNLKYQDKEGRVSRQWA